MLCTLDRQLLASSKSGDVNEVLSLLERGANANCKGKSTPLHTAAWNGHVECIKALLDNGAEVNEEENGCTPLHFAALAGHVECIMALLNRGAGVNIKDHGGKTPLHNAAWQGNLECIRALLDNGAEVNTQGNDGRASVHYAAWHGHVECMKALLDQGAEVDPQDGDDGWTPLHYAAENGSLGCIKALLVSGAMVTIQNTRGQTALDKALECGHQDAVDAISSHSMRRTDGDQQPDQNSSGSLQTENEELRIQLATARSMNDECEEQLAIARAKYDESEVRMACMMGKEDVLASQDLEMLEPLLAKVDLGCLMKAVLEKRVQRAVAKALNAASECSLCLYAPKDTCLDPCGHMMCESCSVLIQLCPICRQTVAQRRRVFLHS